MPGILEFLLPKERKFLDLLKAQADILLEGATEFHSFVINFKKLKKEERKEVALKLHEIETRGDAKMGEIIDGLHETFITPLDREDIYALTSGMEEVLDFLYSAASTMMMYDVKKTPDNVKEFVKILSKCCEIINQTVGHLNDFENMKKTVVALANYEAEADKLYYNTMEGLFKDVEDIKELIKMKDIYRLLEESIDKCNRIGVIMGNIVVKHG